MSDEIKVYEEDFKVIWGMAAFSSGLAGIFFLNMSFSLFEIFIKLPVILASLVCFTFSFYAAFKAAEDLHEIAFHIHDNSIVSRIFKREELVKEETIPLTKIKCFYIEPKIQPKDGEAIYDYTSNYYLKYQTIESSNLLPFINLGSYTLSFKLEDIEKLITFIQKYNPNIYVISKEFTYMESNMP